MISAISKHSQSSGSGPSSDCTSTGFSHQFTAGCYGDQHQYTTPKASFLLRFCPLRFIWASVKASWASSPGSTC